MNPIKPYSKIKKLLQTGEKTSSEILETCLQNIKTQEDLNAFVNIYPEEARKRGFLLDNGSLEEKTKPLHGMVVGIKDMFSYRGHPMQAGSKILEGYIAKYNATSVQRLIDNNAIIVGHQNCDEFGMGSSNENSVFGPVRNYLDKKRVPGGSSGGSAVAVQAGMCHTSLATDTGGSVRQPASFCGIVGLKPTYSRISRFGVVSYASSLDTVSILAQNVEDCAFLLEVISGSDRYDCTTTQRPVDKYSQDFKFNSKPKIAFVKESLELGNLQKEVRQNTQESIKRLQLDGHVVEPISLPLLHYALPTYYILSNAEASSNLACYDGVRYGYRAKSFSGLTDMYKKTRTQGFGEEVKRRIIIGTYALSKGSAGNWIAQAQKIRRLVRDSICKVFSNYDFLILPTTPTTAFEIGEIQNHLDMYAADLFTAPASLAGLPAISIPNGIDDKGLPTGLQIIASPFEEHKLLAFSKEVISKNKKL